ncbi:unnamed protein product [Rhizophagus irregularis]|nr:unnamed protein product [Rhizophagus irregularis]
MYKVKRIYFMSNLMNLNYDYQFQGSYLNRRTLFLNDNYLRLPEFSIADMFSTPEFSIANIFIIEKFPIYMENSEKKHVLAYEDLLELEGLGWILYVPLRSIYLNKHNKIQLSIETKKDSIDMQIEYSQQG